MTISIRWKLTASFVLLAAATAAVISLFSFFLIQSYVDRKEAEYLTAMANSVASQVGPMIGRRDMGEMQRVASVIGYLNDIRIKILDGQNRVLADSRVEVIEPQRGIELIINEELGNLFIENRMHMYRIRPGANAPRFSLFRSWMDARTVDGGSVGDRTNRDEPGSERPPSSDRAFLVPIQSGQNILGYVEVSDAPDLTFDTVGRARNVLILSGASALLFAAAIGLLFSHRLTAPLLRLTETVRGMSDKNLSARVPVTGEDEIGQLSRQFNNLTERLERSFESLSRERDTLKKFAADASHELRTPIQALLTFNHLLEGKAGKDPESRREFLKENKLQLERLDWIVNSLLDLSRFDAGLVELNLEARTLEEIFSVAVQAVSGNASSRNIIIKVDSDSAPLEIFCDRQRILIALINLLDNAIKFSEPNTHVSIEATRGMEEFVISIRDEGPGINQEDLPHIFKRFYRSSTTSASGSGLGLSLVESVIEAHSGRVEVSPNPGMGAEFRIILPLEPTR